MSQFPSIFSHIEADSTHSWTAAEQQQLTKLWWSDECSCQLLVLQMLSGQNLDMDWVCRLIGALHFTTEERLRQEIKRFIAQFASPDFVEWMQPILEKESYQARLDALITHPEINISIIADEAYRWQHLAKNLLLQYGGISLCQLPQFYPGLGGVLRIESPIPPLTPDIAHISGLSHLIITGDAQHDHWHEIPEFVFHMTTLENLVIDSVKLANLSSDIRKLRHLQRLRLASNQLTRLPAALGKMHKLKTLTLYSNRLHTLPSELGELSELEELWLFDNQIAQLPPSLSRLTALKHLHLAHNHLHELPEWVAALDKLEEINLNNNPIRRLPSSLSALPNLKRITLGRNPHFTRKTYQWLRKILPQGCVLRYDK